MGWEYSENGTANEKTKGVLQIWERESVGDSERKRSSPGHLDTYTHIHTSISSSTNHLGPDAVFDSFSFGVNAYCQREFV